GLAYRLYTLANLVHVGGELDIEAADAAFLQQRVETVGFSPLAVGQLTDLLNARSGPTASRGPVQPGATRPRHLAEAAPAERPTPLSSAGVVPPVGGGAFRLGVARHQAPVDGNGRAGDVGRRRKAQAER